MFDDSICGTFLLLLLFGVFALVFQQSTGFDNDRGGRSTRWATVTFNFLYHVPSVQNCPKDDMTTIQMRRPLGGNEKLRSIRIPPRVGHGKHTGSLFAVVQMNRRCWVVVPFFFLLLQSITNCNIPHIPQQQQFRTTVRTTCFNWKFSSANRPSSSVP